MKRAAFIPVSVIVACLMAGCLKREDYPDEPRISFKSFDVGSDSAALIMAFTDGDGNFGLKDGEYEGENYDCQRFYNAYFEYYERQNGQWIFTDLDPCENPNAVPFYYRVPFVEPSGQFKAQKGELKVEMETWYLPSPNDTFRFEIRVVDIDQHVSNVIVTPEFIKP